MYDINKISDVMAVSSELRKVALAFHRALSEGKLVEIRVEDIPALKMDSILRTKLNSVKINDEENHIWINTDELNFSFEFEEFEEGSFSLEHDKFYFKSQAISLTIIVLYD